MLAICINQKNSIHSITLLAHDLSSHTMGRVRIRFMINVKLRVRIGSGPQG